jgi:hypothetical protein
LWNVDETDFQERARLPATWVCAGDIGAAKEAAAEANAEACGKATLMAGISSNPACLPPSRLILPQARFTGATAKTRDRLARVERGLARGRERFFASHGTPAPEIQCDFSRNGYRLRTLMNFNTYTQLD